MLAEGWFRRVSVLMVDRKLFDFCDHGHKKKGGGVFKAEEKFMAQDWNPMINIKLHYK